jgi:alkaline phosphatase
MFRNLTRVVFLIFLSGTLARGDGPARARYVFLFIGDGMGVRQVEAADKALAAAKREPLAVRAFPVAGSQRTRSSSSEVTDSAAAATALATGVRTKNGMLSVTPDEKVLKTIAEEAAEQGIQVGILTSVSIDHATPAAFYAHCSNRGSTSDIARMLAESTFAFFAGGGMAGQKSKDGAAPDNLQRAIQNGFMIARTRESLAALQPGGKAYAFNHRLAGGAALPWSLDARADDVSLAEYTDAAIRLLTSEKGFFMMVEGGKIDWACYANDLGTAVGELLAFDAAIRRAVDFCRAHPADTLIVVTADHETGGLEAIEGGPFQPDRLLAQSISGEALGAELGPLKARRAGFAEAQVVLEKRLGWVFSDISETNRAECAKAWNDAPEGKQDLLVSAVRRIAARQAGYRYTTGGHSKSDVPLWAMGVGAEAFAGVCDNTEVHRKIRAALLGQ